MMILDWIQSGEMENLFLLDILLIIGFLTTFLSSIEKAEHFKFALSVGRKNAAHF